MSVNCYACGVAIELPADVESTLRRTGSTFYCHVGHGQSFRVKPDERDREIESLKRQARWSSETIDDLLREREELRVERRTCPVCGERRRTRRTMLRHLEDAHVSAGVELVELAGVGR